MSLIKHVINCFLVLKIKSPNSLLKSIANRHFKNAELFSIIFNEGVIDECLMQKNSAKNNEYFRNNPL